MGTDRLYRSADKGDNNAQASQVFGGPISAIGISPQNDNARIVGLQNGRVFATTTGSSTLTDVTGPIPAKYIARAVIDPGNSNTAYVTLDGYGLSAGQHVWKTTNLNGAPPTWTAMGSGIPDVPVNAFVVNPLSSQNLYVGTDIGVYRSTNGGTSWTPFSNGLPPVAVFDMAFQARGQVFPGLGQVLRIATHGRGIWEIVSPTGTILEFLLPTANSVPRGIAAGPDGALWFAEAAGNQIGRIITDGTILEFLIPTANSAPVGITAGPDGALWFTESVYFANRIGQITTDGTITEFLIPTSNSDPEGITAGPDGALWFTEYFGNRIGRIPTDPPPVGHKVQVSGRASHQTGKSVQTTGHTTRVTEHTTQVAPVRTPATGRATH